MEHTHTAKGINKALIISKIRIAADEASARQYVLPGGIKVVELETLNTFAAKAVSAVNEISSESGIGLPASDPGAHTERIVTKMARQQVPDMPTYEELKARGQLYSQRAHSMSRSSTIVDHLLSIWRPWIEAGILTRPELLHRDLSSYKALAKWLNKQGNDLTVALGGYDIPTLSKHLARSPAVSPREKLKAAYRHAAKYRRDLMKTGESAL